MPESLRTFIGVKIEPHPPSLNLMNSLKKSLADEKIKWVEPDKMHLTLKFLGDTSPSQVEKIKTILRETGENFSAFDFNLKGVGFFKRNRQPKVLFVNIDNIQVLKQLAHEIDTKISAIGFEKEKREFKPHLTLGRIKYLKNKAQFYKTVEEFSNSFIQQVKINEIIFYQSILKPDGPEYKSLLKVELNSI